MNYIGQHSTTTFFVIASIFAGGYTASLAADGRPQKETRTPERAAIVVAPENFAFTRTERNNLGDHVAELRIEDGAVTVKLNGEDVPESRLKKEGDRIIILDSEGNRIEAIELHMTASRGDPLRLELAQDPLRAFGTYKLATTPKVMMGVHLGEPGPALEEHLQLEPGTTTMITAISAGLPADRAGIKQYDIITMVEGESPANPDALRSVLATKAPGQPIRLKLIQKGEAKQIEVKLEAFDPGQLQSAPLVGYLLGSDDLSISRFYTGDDSIRSFAWSAENGKAINESLQNIYVSPHVSTLGPPNQWLSGGQANAQNSELDARLEKLDERLRQLEQLLDRLLEASPSGR